MQIFPKNSLPILITGWAGVPGFNTYGIWKHLGCEGLFGLRSSSSSETSDPCIYTIDAEDSEILTNLFLTHQFKTIVDASGCCALKSCEYNPELAELLNVRFGVSLAKLAVKHHSQFIRLSSDLIFDGAREGNYREDSDQNPLTHYGKSMVKAEREILAINKSTCILRISLPMGPSANGHAGAIDWIASRFKKNLPATLYFDEIRSSFYVQDMVTVLEKVILNGLTGIFHLGGPLPLSLYKIAQVINKYGDYSPELLMGCPRLEAGPIPPRAGNVSMDSSKLTEKISPETLKPWPLIESYPGNRNWHLNRDRRRSGLEQELYGYGYPHNPRHPLHFFRQFQRDSHRSSLAPSIS